MQRLLQLEELADAYDEQTDAVRRRLKQHRREIWQQRQKLLPRTTNTPRSRFLPDATADPAPPLPPPRRTASAVTHAQRAVFAKPVVSRQPTLTQMLGGGDGETEDGMVELPEQDKEEDNAVSVAPNSEDGLHMHNDDDDTANNESCVNDADGYVPPLGEAASPAIRLQSNKLDSPTKYASHYSIWDAVRNGNYTSSWDRLFYEEEEEECNGVDHLLGLLGSTQDSIGDKNLASPAHHGGSQHDILPDFSPSSLTIRGKTLANAIKDHIMAHESKRRSIEQVCPNWQENVEFALSRRVGKDVSHALQNVRAAKARLQRNKLAILQKIEQQEAALEVFEDSLAQSLTRFSVGALSSPRCARHPREIVIPERPASWARESTESETGTFRSQPFHSPTTTNRSRSACTSNNDRTAEGNGTDLLFCPSGERDTPLSVASIAIASQ